MNFILCIGYSEIVDDVIKGNTRSGAIIIVISLGFEVCVEKYLIYN